MAGPQRFLKNRFSAHGVPAVGRSGLFLKRVACLCLIPLTLYVIVLYNFVCILQIFSWCWRSSRPRASARGGQNKTKRILITGSDEVVVTLALSRLLHSAGYAVYVAPTYPNDATPIWSYLTDYTRRSGSFHKIISLSDDTSRRAISFLVLSLVHIELQLVANGHRSERRRSLAQRLLRLIEFAGIDAWIQCDTDSSRPTVVAEGGIAKQTKCQVITAPHAFPPSGPRFAGIVDELGIGVLCPKTVIVASRTEIHNIIWDAPSGVEFELTRLPEAEKPYEEGSASSSNDETTVIANVEEKSLRHRRKRDSGYVSNFNVLIDDDVGDLEDVKEKIGDERIDQSTDTTKLPLLTMNATYNQVAAMHVSSARPWILTPTISGKASTVSTLVINNQVRVFIATLSSSRYSSPLPTDNDTGHASQTSEDAVLLDASSALSQSLLAFTNAFAERLLPGTSTHLNIHFIVSEVPTSTGAETRIWPLSCDFKAPSWMFRLAIYSMLSKDVAEAYVIAGAAGTKSDEFGDVGIEHREDLRASREVKDIKDLSPLMLPQASSRSQRAHDKIRLYSIFPLTYSALLCPFLTLVRYPSPTTARQLIQGVLRFAETLLYGYEELFDLRDPWPWIWRWSVTWVLEGLFN